MFLKRYNLLYHAHFFIETTYTLLETWNSWPKNCKVFRMRCKLMNNQDPLRCGKRNLRAASFIKNVGSLKINFVLSQKRKILSHIFNKHLWILLVTVNLNIRKRIQKYLSLHSFLFSLFLLCDFNPNVSFFTQTKTE